VVYMIMLLGAWHMMRDKLRRAFLIALVCYGVASFIGDKAMDTNTLMIGKLRFFTISMSLFLLAAGMSHLPGRFHIRTILPIVCCCLLFGNSLAICFNKNNYDGPRHVASFRDNIVQRLGSSGKGLVIFNSRNRRPLLSFVHTVEAAVDLWVLPAEEIKSNIPGDRGLNDYDYVFIANQHVGYGQRIYLLPEIQLISDYLEENNFALTETIVSEHEPRKSSLMVFGKL